MKKILPVIIGVAVLVLTSQFVEFGPTVQSQVMVKPNPTNDPILTTLPLEVNTITPATPNPTVYKPIVKKQEVIYSPTPSPTPALIDCQLGDSVYRISADQCATYQAKIQAEPSYPPCTIYYPATKLSQTYNYTTPEECKRYQDEANSFSPHDYTSDFQNTTDQFQKDSEAITNSVPSYSPPPLENSVHIQQPTSNPTDTFGNQCSNYNGAATGDPSQVGCP